MKIALTAVGTPIVLNNTAIAGHAIAAGAVLFPISIDKTVKLFDPAGTECTRLYLLFYGSIFFPW